MSNQEQKIADILTRIMKPGDAVELIKMLTGLDPDGTKTPLDKVVAILSEKPEGKIQKYLGNGIELVYQGATSINVKRSQGDSDAYPRFDITVVVPKTEMLGAKLKKQDMIITLGKIFRLEDFPVKNASFGWDIKLEEAPLKT